MGILDKYAELANLDFEVNEFCSFAEYKFQSSISLGAGVQVMRHQLCSINTQRGD